jgi:hypothetical protein
LGKFDFGLSSHDKEKWGLLVLFKTLKKLVIEELSQIPLQFWVAFLLSFHFGVLTVLKEGNRE